MIGPSGCRWILISIAVLSGCAHPTSDTHIAFRAKDGRVLTWDEVNKVGGEVNYEAVGPKKIPPEAKALYEQGCRAALADDHRLAISLFEQATKIAPGWLHPINDEALEYMLLDDWDQAEKLYARVCDLAPRGFYSASVALDHLRREREGTLPRGTYLRLFYAAYDPDTISKSNTVRSILNKSPAAPMAWQLLAGLENDNQAKLHAISEGLKYDPDPETKGILLMYQAEVLRDQGHEKEAVQLLGGLAMDPRSTMQVEHLSKLFLRNILEGRRPSH